MRLFIAIRLSLTEMGHFGNTLWIGANDNRGLDRESGQHLCDFRRKRHRQDGGKAEPVHQRRGDQRSKARR